MSNWTAEFVLTLAQPYLKHPIDLSCSRAVSKALNENGKMLQNSLPKLQDSIERNRKKTEKNRLEKKAEKAKLSNVYTEKELGRIHEQVKKFSHFDIFGENVDLRYLNWSSYYSGVYPGWYIPVMYYRQKSIIFSLVFNQTKHTKEEEKIFLKTMKGLGITLVYNVGDRMNKPMSFSAYDSTGFVRWFQKWCRISPIVNIG